MLVLLLFPKGDKKSLYHADETYTPPEVIDDEEKGLDVDKHKPLVMPDIAQDEYDFMSGPEGLTTKIDLARVYIDMGDKDRARELLGEVMVSGDDEQKRSAEEMLAKI